MKLIIFVMLLLFGLTISADAIFPRGSGSSGGSGIFILGTSLLGGSDVLQ